MSKHTPGPWRFVEREVMEDGTVYPRHIVGGSRELEICPLEHSNIAELAIKGYEIFSSDRMLESDDDVRSKLANARLIAAAPDMLEALLQAREWLESWASAESQLAIVNAAIDKAGGRS